MENGIGFDQNELASELLASFSKLRLDLKAAASMGRRQARYAVNTYYEVQRIRIATEHQVRQCEKRNEPTNLLKWIAGVTYALEYQIRRALGAFAENAEVGRWALGILGIGPVLSAGLLAHIDMNRAPTVGHIWRFAGLDPQQKWIGAKAAEAFVAQFPEDTPLEDIIVRAVDVIHCRPETLVMLASTNPQGKKIRMTRETVTRAIAKRPWNEGLKTLCWKIGESFVKVSNKPNSLYGRIYKERKALEWQRNLAGENAEYAKHVLTVKRFGLDTMARAWYSGEISAPLVEKALRDATPLPENLREASEKAGGLVPMLPPAHIHARATRYTVKLFLSHWHEVAYRAHYRKDPPKPYVIDHLKHRDFIGADEAS
jgi:hypothetical protein